MAIYSCTNSATGTMRVTPAMAAGATPALKRNEVPITDCSCFATPVLSLDNRRKGEAAHHRDLTSSVESCPDPWQLVSILEIG